jgi:RHH-type transcriptional regulator, rel operon repressor / antitoxin RelB
MDPTHLRELIEDLEDYFLAAKVFERVRSGEEEIYSSAQVRTELGLNDIHLKSF